MTDATAQRDKSTPSTPTLSGAWNDRVLRALVIGAPFAIVFFALDLGASMARGLSGSGISLWYAPVGVAIAVLLRFGIGYAPIYFLVCVIGNYFIWHQHMPSVPLLPVLVAALPVIVYSFCVWVLRTKLRIDTQLTELRSAAMFVIGVAAASALVAFGYAGLLVAADRVQESIWHSALDFWIGDVVAILSIAPFLLALIFPWGAGVLRFVRGESPHAVAGRAVRALLPRFASTAVWFAVLIPTIVFCITESESEGRAILYPCFLPLVFAAYWRGIKGASTGVFFVSASFAIFVVQSGEHAGMHDIQLFLITLCLTTLLLGSAITSVTATSENLRQLHGYYRQAITAADAVPYVLDYEQGRYTYVGENIERITGYTSREFTPRLWEERTNIVTLHGEAAGIPEADAIRRTRAGEFQTWSSEGNFLTRDGKVRWVADASVEVHGEDGKSIRSIGLIQDISRLKEAEEALRASRAVLYLFVEHTPAAVAMLDRELRYLVASKRWLLDYRLTEQDIIGKCHYDVFPEIRSNQDWLDVHQRCLRGAIEKRDEDRFVRADGTEDWLRWEVRPWYEDSGAIGGIIMFTEVITERKKAEEALRKGEERLELALNGADLGLWDLDIAGARATVNQRCAEIFGYSMETVPQDVMIWRSHVHPDDLPAVSDHMWAHVGRHCPNLDIEFRIHTRIGRPVWIQVRGKVVEWEAGGTPVRIAGTVMDITARKAADEERRAFEEQMQQTQKLESLGVLAGGIAHDFNNLLVGILGNADLALAETPSNSSLHDSLDAIVRSSERAAELCRQMLAYSGRGRFVVVPVSLNDMVEEMGHLLTVTVSRRVTLTFDPDPNLPLVQADATQLRQIIMNLITNASEAIGDSEGAIRMSTGRLVWGGDDGGQHILGGELRESQAYAYVRVTDNGVGMDNATLQRIFDPFFTTKFTGRGLGLAAVLGIVRGHRGAIRVESAVGRGTTFTVYLPALGDANAGTSDEEQTVPATRGEGVVLVVDDEESVLGIAKMMLERRGFEVLTALDGAAALRLFDERKDAIILAIVDLTMPRMAGGELIHALHEIKPGLRVVLSSGYNEQEAIAQSHGETMAGFIQKPYRTREFYRVIESALNRGGRTV
ncbi:MAG: PAS domain S-box protein [Candidatus Hydrogenedentes bacterium]|nr:PAS domain S-box protein [Candidatus Hydrogenedentota bacterium]